MHVFDILIQNNMHLHVFYSFYSSVNPSEIIFRTRCARVPIYRRSRRTYGRFIKTPPRASHPKYLVIYYYSMVRVYGSLAYQYSVVYRIFMVYYGIRYKSLVRLRSFCRLYDSSLVSYTFLSFDDVRDS